MKTNYVAQMECVWVGEAVREGDRWNGGGSGGDGGG